MRNNGSGVIFVILFLKIDRWDYMKVLITAGGTTEPIDSVRSITNTSTGKLGSIIAETYEKIYDVTKIYYVCGKNSILPQSKKVDVRYVDTVVSLEHTVRNIINNDSIDIIIHSMAVSDYRVKAVTSAAMLSSSLYSKLDSLTNNKQQLTDNFIISLFQNTESIINNDGKIGSNINNLLLCMEQTPKIISLYKTIAPEALLVGFKLLDYVSVEELIDTAYQLLKNNHCNFVLANDLKNISKDQHIGYLVDENKQYIKFTTKQEIAEAIVKASMKRRGLKI